MTHFFAAYCFAGVAKSGEARKMRRASHLLPAASLRAALPTRPAISAIARVPEGSIRAAHPATNPYRDETIAWATIDWFEFRHRTRLALGATITSTASPMTA